MQEVAVVPVLGDWVGKQANNCSNGNVIDHTAQALAGPGGERSDRTLTLGPEAG